MQTQISLIVPIYNTKQSLYRCIESIQKQSFQSFELILIDDGSTDGSSELCDYYSTQDSRIKVLHQKNSGVSHARNTGIQHATGKYIAFIDSDDWIETDFLLRAFTKCESAQIDWYINGYLQEFYIGNQITQSIEYTITASKYYNIRTLLEAYKIEFTHNITAVWAKLYKSSIIHSKHITFDITMNYGEDTLFNLQYLQYCKDIFFDSALYYHYTTAKATSLSSPYRYHPDLFAACVKNTQAFERLCHMHHCHKTCQYMNYARFATDILFCIQQEYTFNKSTRHKYSVLQTISQNYCLYSIQTNTFNLYTKFILWLLQKKYIHIIHLVYCLRNCIFRGTLHNAITGI